MHLVITYIFPHLRNSLVLKQPLLHPVIFAKYLRDWFASQPDQLLKYAGVNFQ